MPTQAGVHPELRRIARACPESLTDEEVMLVLCDSAGADTASGATSSEELFSEIYRRYQRRVIAWCFRLTGNRTRAVDLAQEVFFKAYRHRNGFRGDSRFSTWLYAITRNHCLSALRKLPDPADTGESIPLRLRDASTIQPDIRMERRETHGEMWRMIGATLEPMEARVMALHYGYEWPLAAITKRLELSNPSGAKAYVVNARRKLNLMLQRRASRKNASAQNRTAA